MRLHTVGERETITYRWLWRECSWCEKPAKFRLSYLLPNARSNPASSGYGGDNISWCEDHEEFACKEHERTKKHSVDSYKWCSSFPLKRYQYMGFYRKEIEA